MSRTRLRISFLLAFLALVIAAWLARALWLPWFGYLLVHDDGPAKADIAVVLAGDQYGHRIETGAELVRAGYVPIVLVSGPTFYGAHESDQAINYAVRKGYPIEWFISFPIEANSTREEAGAILPELRRRGVQKFLLVTSDYHTGRAGRIFRATESAMGGGPEMRVVASHDESFRAGSWWRKRESQKITLMEWVKTVATALGH